MNPRTILPGKKKGKMVRWGRGEERKEKGKDKERGYQKMF